MPDGSPVPLAGPAASWLASDGFTRHAHALDGAAMRHLEAILAAIPASAAGVRLQHLPGLAPMLTAGGPVGSVVTSVLGAARPVRAILFNKSPDNNWALGWH